MKYNSHDLSSTQLSGTHVNTQNHFVPWQPSTWPEVDENFLENIEKILNDIVFEIKNVVSDAEEQNGGLSRRGHVVALALFCSVDTLSSYAFRERGGGVCKECGKGEKIGPRYQEYIKKFFPDDYKPHAEVLYKNYRTNFVHSWNLFSGSITPGDEKIKVDGDKIQVGLLDFLQAVKFSVEKLIQEMQQNEEIYDNCVARYNFLRESATE